jgi:DNA-binding LacI/PurR family transcriptional regulator
VQVQRALRSVIDEHFTDGDQFYTESALVERLRVSRGTVRQALNELSREGMLVRRVRTGTMVCKQGAPWEGQAVKSQAVQTVGVFVAQYDSDFLSAVLEQVSLVCRERDLRFKVYHTHKGQKVADAYREVGGAPDQERILLLGQATMGQLNEALTDRGYRVVALEAPTDDYAGAVVETDSTMAVHIAVDYLWSLGHRRITLLVNEPYKSPSVAEKVDAFQEIARRRDVDTQFRTVLCGTDFWQSSHAAALAHMDEVWPDAELERPTAIFAVSDPGAWAALQWFAKRGVSVPREVSVLGYEGARTSQFTHPALSTVSHSFERIARAAIDLLWTGTQTTKRLAPELVIRESTGSVPQFEK